MLHDVFHYVPQSFIRISYPHLQRGMRVSEGIYPHLHASVYIHTISPIEIVKSIYLYIYMYMYTNTNFNKPPIVLRLVPALPRVEE